MKRLSATVLALSLAAAGAASAQDYYGYDPYGRDDGSTRVYPDRDGRHSGAIYDYARVVRVDPVIDSRHGYGTSGQRCYYRDATYADGYGRDPYDGDGYYGRDPYGRDGYYDPYTGQRRHGTEAGRTMATVLGGIAGAVLGSKIGDGSGATAATAVGAMVGGMAGQKIYEQAQRERYRTGTVRVCEPVRADGYGRYPVNDGRVVGYDVTYEYAGRRFTTRTDYHPGDRIRVRVEVIPE